MTHTTQQEVRDRLRALSFVSAPVLSRGVMPVRAVHEIIELGIALHEGESEEERN